MTKAVPKEVRAARSFLFSKGANAGQISPRKFANAAKELNIGFSELLRFISRLYAGGQNQKQFRMEVIREAASK